MSLTLSLIDATWLDDRHALVNGSTRPKAESVPPITLIQNWNPDGNK